MLKVRAKKLGFIHGGRKRPGTEFMCSEQEFSHRWMELIDEPKVEEQPKPKRKRRTKAEIEADKSAESSEAANLEAETEATEVSE